MSGARGRIAWALTTSAASRCLLQLMFRLAIASVFLKAGLNKIASWELTVQLFADEYKVPVLPPDFAAAMASTFEIGCSILLILGLAHAAGDAAAARHDRGDPDLRLSERLRRAPDVGVDPALPAHARRRAAGRSTASSVWSRRISRPTDVGEQPSPARPALPAWRRLAVRLAVAFALLTFLSVAIVGVLVRERQKREVEDTVGTQLLNIARVAVLLVDPALHAEVAATPAAPTPTPTAACARALAAMQREVLLTTPIRTLAEFDRTGRRARVVVTSDGAEQPGDLVALAPELIEPIAWSLEDGVARYTRRLPHRAGHLDQRLRADRRSRRAGRPRCCAWTTPSRSTSTACTSSTPPILQGLGGRGAVRADPGPALRAPADPADQRAHRWR